MKDFYRKQLVSFSKRYRTYIFLFVILGFCVMAIQFGVDEKLVALVGILLGLLTQAFVAILGILALIPWIGPFIVKLLSIPVFWIINAVSNLIGVIAVKQGYGKEIASSRLMAIILIIGMILGYLLGHWFPF